MRQTLGMLDINQQVPCHGGLNAALCEIRATGVQDASVSLFDDLVQLLSNASATALQLSELELLTTKEIAARSRAQLTSAPEWSDPSTDLEQLKERRATCVAARAQTGNRAVRAAAEATNAIVADRIEKIRDSLDRWFRDQPLKVAIAAEAVRSFMRGLELPTPNGEPLARLSQILRTMDELMLRRSSVTAQTYEFATAQLAHRARAAYDDTLGAITAQLAVEALAEARVPFLSWLDSFVNRIATFEGRLTAIRAHLEQIQNDAANRQQVSRASVVLSLPGPDEKQVRAGISARLGAQTDHELALKLLPQYRDRLAAIGKVECPWLEATQASIVELLLAVEPKLAADEFGQLIEKSLGIGHSLYEVIDAFGVQPCAEFLFDRAHHLNHLQGRDREAFHVSTLQLSLARLPPPVGPKDAEIRSRLWTAFEQLDDFLLCEGSPTDTAVTVVRAQIGWPIGIEESNASLLERYAQAASQGHLPHLLGILDDSPYGAASPRYLELASRPTSEKGTI